jgi:hypothetical protein
MASSYTGNSGIEKPAEGDQTGEWGDTVNTNMDIIDRAINGVGAITLSGTTHTLTTTDGTLSDGGYKVLVLGGSPSGTNTITISPNDQDKVYFVVNSSGQTATFSQGSGANVSVLNGDIKIIYADGAGSGAAVVDITANLSFSSVNIDGGTIDGTAIGGTTPAAGAFTTVTASGTLGVTGVTTHGDDVVSDTDSTDDLGTTGVRWANLFVDGITATDQITATGFTGTLDGILGSGSAAAATTTTLDTSGAVNLNLTTDSTSSTSGALIIDGGVGVAKKLFVGTDFDVSGNAVIDGTTLMTGVTTHGDDVVSDTDSTDDLGTTGVRWANLFVDGITATDQITATGFTGTLDGILGSGAAAAATTTTLASSSITASGIIKTDDTTEATSTTDGSLQTDGGLSVVKDAVFGDDVKLITDEAVIHFGVDSEITLTHVHNDGLLLKRTATADDSKAVLTLQTGEIDIAVDDVIASVNFQAPDEGAGSDAILVAAGIEAVSEGDFSSSSNATKLSFKTAASEAATEKMSLSSAGVLTVSGAITSSGIVTGTAFTAGSAVLAEAELELLDGLTAGTAIASKVVTTDASIDTSGQRNLTISGELDAATLDISGDADIDGTLEADAMTLNGTAITATATLSTGISNTNVPVFTSGVADDDFLRVAGTSIEGRSAAEVLSDIGASAAAGSGSIVTTGALNSGSITSGFGAIDNGAAAITTTGVITGGTVEATTDTAAADNAAIGYTAAEGLILTGQGSTNDVTIKNDADADVIEIPTGTTNVTVVGTLGVGGTVSAASSLIPGTVIQRPYVYHTSATQLTSAGALHELSTSLRVAITPKHASSILFLECSAWFCSPNTINIYWAHFYDVTNTEVPFLPTASGSRSRVHWSARVSDDDPNDFHNMNFIVAGTAGSTDARTYTIWHGTEGATAQFLASTLSSATGVTAPIFFSVTEIYNP